MQLDAKLSRVKAEQESARAALTKAGEERERVERAEAESIARTLEAEQGRDRTLDIAPE